MNQERRDELKQIIQKMGTRCLLMANETDRVFEWGDIKTPLPLYQMRESIVSTLMGIAVAENKITLGTSLESLNFDDRDPSLSDEEKQATIADLLCMRSGIFHEAANVGFEEGTGKPPRNSHLPGKFWFPNPWDVNALAAIYEQKCGMTLAEGLEAKLAIPLGMEFFQKDRDSRQVRIEDSLYPCWDFSLAASDFIRLGQMYLLQGKWGSQQILPRNWIEASTVSYSIIRPGIGFGYLWWIGEGWLFGNKVNGKAYAQREPGGGFLVILPDLKLVIVHLLDPNRPRMRIKDEDLGNMLRLIIGEYLIDPIRFETLNP